VGEPEAGLLRDVLRRERVADPPDKLRLRREHVRGTIAPLTSISVLQRYPGYVVEEAEYL
jgi:hypothetical protein